MMDAVEKPNTEELMRRRGYVTPKAAAAHIGRDVHTIRTAIEEGKLRVIRMGDGPKARQFVEWRSLLEWIGPEAATALGLVQS